MLLSGAREVAQRLEYLLGMLELHIEPLHRTAPPGTSRITAQALSQEHPPGPSDCVRNRNVLPSGSIVPARGRHLWSERRACSLWLLTPSPLGSGQTHSHCTRLLPPGPAPSRPLLALPLCLPRFDMQLAQALGESVFERRLREKVIQENASIRWELGLLQQQLKASARGHRASLHALGC